MRTKQPELMRRKPGKWRGSQTDRGIGLMGQADSTTTCPAGQGLDVMQVESTGLSPRGTMNDPGTAVYKRMPGSHLLEVARTGSRLSTDPTAFRCSRPTWPEVSRTSPWPYSTGLGIRTSGSEIHAESSRMMSRCICRLILTKTSGSAIQGYRARPVRTWGGAPAAAEKVSWCLCRRHGRERQSSPANKPRPAAWRRLRLVEIVDDITWSPTTIFFDADRVATPCELALSSTRSWLRSTG